MRYLFLLLFLLACSPLTLEDCQHFDEKAQEMPERCLEIRAFPAGPDLKIALSTNYDERMRAANLNFTAGCLLTAIDMCANMNDTFKERNKCYDKMQATCSTAAHNYEVWLRSGR